MGSRCLPDASRARMKSVETSTPPSYNKLLYHVPIHKAKYFKSDGLGAIMI